MNDTDNIKVKRNLTALIEFSRIINSSLNLEFILNNVLLTCMGKFLATKGLVALSIEGKIIPKASKGLAPEIIETFPDLIAEHSKLESPEFIDYLHNAKLIVFEKIRSSDECLGIVCLGEKLNKSPFTEDDLEFLGTILNISASAIQNSMVIEKLKHVNRMLDSRIQRLNSLFELSKEFGLFSEAARVAKLLVYSVIGQFLVSKFAVTIFKDGNINILESKYSEKDLLSALKEYNYEEISNSLTKSKIEKDFKKLNNLNIELIVPMQLQGKTKGLILLGKRINNQDFTETDIEFIYSVGSLAIVSLENISLFEETLAKQKMEEELEIAKGIQMNLFPSLIPQFSNYDIAAESLTSQQVGGDYYDLISLDNKSFCIAIADVSGKGVPAALLMANLQAFLKTTTKHGMMLKEATALINDLVSENTSDGKFITFFWGVFDNENLTLEYVNAGHNPPLLIRDGKIIKLTKGGIILGVMKTQIPYQSETIRLQKNDVLVMFTDGITEAKNVEDEEYSDERFERLVPQLVTQSPSQILKTIQNVVKTFADGTPQSDDMTIVVLKVK